MYVEIVLTAVLWFLSRYVFQKSVGEKWGSLSYALFGCTSPRFVEYYFYHYPEKLDYDRCGEAGMNEFERRLITVSVGYFLNSILRGLLIQEVWYMQVHHVISFATVFAPLYYQCCAFELFVCIWVGEFTAPCAFWIFRYEKEPQMYNSKPMMVVKIIYFVFFVILRFGIGSYTLWRFLNSTETLLIIKLGCLLMMAFNCVIVKQAIEEVKRFIFYQTIEKAKEKLQ